jgi:hypothetical protein
VRGPHAWRFGHAPRAWGTLLATPMLRISSDSGPEATWERARRFVPPAHGDQCPSHATCGSGFLCQRLSCSGARYAPRRFFQGARGAISRRRGFPRAVVLLSHFPQLLRPLASEPSTPLRVRASQFSAAVVAMAMLVHPDHYQTEEALDSVHRILGMGLACVRQEDPGRHYSPW